MIYLQRSPAAPLSGSVRSIWYARMTNPLIGQERILPNGCVQIVISLTAALVVGARSSYEIIERSDMEEVAGIVFQPGGFTAFVSDAADLFTNRYTALSDVWGSRANRLRDAIAEAATPEGKLDAMERALAGTESHASHPMVRFALNRIAQAPGVSSVAEIAAQTGWSMRRFSQVFREQVGVTPIQWRRIQRFQRAVRQLHAGAEIAWADLAIDCGYYDQSHFANEFRAFSGIDATTYSARRTQWTNHVRV
jgi:methylphosphotriester-DNA--protein-cysteine methyltransferase